MTKHVHVHLGRRPTADAEDGRWVTINGTHVMIGKGGKIIKGPADLKGKTHGEAHEHAAKQHEKAHGEEANKGNGPQAQKHGAAADAHKAAAALHKAGHPDAEKASVKAEQAHADTKVVHTAAPKPKSHEKLHQEAGSTVNQIGSKKHQEEHKRLMEQYDKSSANWEREATNRQISKNAVHAKWEHADKADVKARELSAAAHKSGDLKDHDNAHRALKHAIHAHGHAGGVGYAKKQEELEALRKGHESAMKAGQKPKADEAVGKAPASAPASAPAPAKADVKAQNAQMTHGKPKTGPAGPGKPGTPGNPHDQSKKAAVVLAAAKEAAAEAKKVEASKNKASGEALADKNTTPAQKKSITQEAHADAAASHKAKANAWKNPAHGEGPEEGGNEVAAMHEEAAAHHEHMANNPNEDHSARGAKLRDLKQRIGAAESLINMGKGHEVSGKAKPPAPGGGGKAPSKPQNAPKGGGSGGSGGKAPDNVQQATEAVKGITKLIKKTGEEADPDPKKQ